MGGGTGGCGGGSWGGSRDACGGGIPGECRGDFRGGIPARNSRDILRNVFFGVILTAPGTSICRPPQFSPRSEEHTSELQSLRHLVCRLLLEKKKMKMFFCTISVS